MPRAKHVKSDTTICIELGEVNPKQELFYQSRTPYTAYGGAKGGGKTHAVRTKAIGGAIRWPGIRILIVRRTYPELQQNHIEPILKIVPQEAAGYNSTHHTLRFINGSVIKFGHYNSATAEQEYQGQEYDWIFIDEATQFTEREFRYLGGCLRGTCAAPKRFYITCNPGGVGHRWVKRLFIDRDFKAHADEPERCENPDDYTFIPATVEDNEHLLQSSPSYLAMLSNLPESMRRAYRFGDWNALSGAYFPELSRGRHMTVPICIPDSWLRYRALDYGLDMLACLWIAVDDNGRCWVYRELKEPGLVVSDASRRIAALTPPGERIAATFAPPDIWSRQKDTGRTMAALFFKAGVPIVRADSSRVHGHMLIKDMLLDRPDGRPGLLFFETCRELVADLQAIQADETNPSDCAKQPHDVTHTVDALRYFCVSRAAPPSVDGGHDTDTYTDFMTGGEPRMGYFRF